jgi:thiol:disulfide interchange protein
MVGEYKDKHWDAKFNQFKLAKEQRKQDEMARSGVQIPEKKESTSINLNRVGYNSYRNKIKPTKEERIFINKGPSRFLKTHGVNQEEQVTSSQNVSNTPQLTVYEDTATSSQTPIINNTGRWSKIKLSFTEILPYIFIILGIILAILVIKKSI